MSKVFVVRNQLGLFANKHKEWLDGREPKLLFRSPHKDEAINLVFELSSKDIYLRAEAISVELDDHKQPVVEVTAELPPEPPLDAANEDQPDNSEHSQTSGQIDTGDSTTETAEDSRPQGQAELLAD